MATCGNPHDTHIHYNMLIPSPTPLGFSGSSLSSHACLSSGTVGPLSQKAGANLANTAHFLQGLSPSSGSSRPCRRPMYILLNYASSRPTLASPAQGGSRADLIKLEHTLLNFTPHPNQHDPRSNSVLSNMLLVRVHLNWGQKPDSMPTTPPGGNTTPKGLYPRVR